MIKKTALYDRLNAYKPHMVDFAGWNMPLYFRGIIPEHLNVRKAAGIFDVSHMGKLLFRLSDEVRRLFTIDIGRMTVGKAKYTMMLDSDGVIIDDMIIYRLSDELFFLVPNAYKVKAINERILTVAKTETDDLTDRLSILSIQGPRSKEIMQKIFNELDMRFYEFRILKSPCKNTGIDRIIPPDHILISRTGYTGELGYEIYCEASITTELFDALMESGKEYGMEPVGLGARDTLRLEKGYLLSGTDFNMDVTPVEANLLKYVDLEHDFVGKNSLLAKLNKSHMIITGLVMKKNKVIPRHGAELFVSNSKVGRVTSGTISPVLEKGIALGYVPSDMNVPGKEIQISIRDKLEESIIVRLPFV